MKISRDDLEFFDQNGYLVVDGVIPLKELSGLKNSLSKVIESVLTKVKKQHDIELIEGENFIDSGLMTLRRLDSKYSTIVQRTISRTPEFFHLCSNPSLVNHVRTVMALKNDGPLYLLSNVVILTDPNNRHDKSPSNFDVEVMSIYCCKF